MIWMLEKKLEKVDEKIMLIAIIGTLEVLKNRVITINEAEKFLFSPYMVKQLSERKCDEKIVNIIEKGCELEDINSLFPEKLNKMIDDLKSETIILLKRYEEYNKVFWLKN